MNHPERRTQQRDILDKHVLALHEIDKLWTHSITRAHLTLLDRDSVLIPLLKQRSAYLLGGDSAGTCIIMPTFRTHTPPVGIVGSSVNSAFTGQGYILGTYRINQRLIIIAIHALPTSPHYRILSGIGGEKKSGTLLKMKIHIVLYGNRTGEPCAFGHHYPAAPFPGTYINHLIDKLGVKETFSLGLLSVIKDLIILGSELRLTDGLLNLRVHITPSLVRSDGGHTPPTQEKPRKHHTDFLHGIFHFVVRISHLDYKGTHF